MVKASDINKDIRSISQKVGVAFFSYDDIHNASINNQFHYDYNRVIQTVSVLQKITPEEAEKRLVDRGILQLLPGEEYAINVGGTTRDGGGINYGEAFFFLSDKDYHTKYHELAHSLQNKYALFDNEKLNALYDKSKKSLKPNENSEDKLLDKKNYAIYLNEMHSEVFGYGALLLRAENKRDFFKHALLAYRSGLDRNAVGFLSFGKTGYGCNGENSSKFYVLDVSDNTAYKKLMFISIDDTHYSFDFETVVNSYVWLDDYNFAYSIKNQGIYRYNILTEETYIILEGQDEFN